MCKTAIRVHDAIGKLPYSPMGYDISWPCQEQVQGDANRRNVQNSCVRPRFLLASSYLFGSGSAGLGLSVVDSAPVAQGDWVSAATVAQPDALIHRDCVFDASFALNHSLRPTPDELKMNPVYMRRPEG